MVYQITVGLLIPFCVQWIYYLPAGRVVVGSCHSLFSLYMLSVFSHLTFRLSLLYWNMFVCSDMLPPAISIVRCFRHMWLLWRSESQGLLDTQKNLWKSGFPRVSEYYFITKSSLRPISGSAPKLMSPSRPGCKKVSSLSETTWRSLRFLFILFSYHFTVQACQTSQLISTCICHKPSCT